MSRLRVLGIGAGAASGAVLGYELWHLTRRRTPRESVEVIRQGYRAGSANELSLLLLFMSFGTTFAGARGVTRMIRSGRGGPLRNVHVGNRHIHHYVPGIVACLVAGGLSIGLRHEEIDQWLAIPFGAGAALILDEAALLLELEDVYWTEEGLLSIEVALGTLALLGGLALVVRIIRRGEQQVQQQPSA